MTVLRRLGAGLTIMLVSGQRTLAQQASSSRDTCNPPADQYLPAFPLRQVIEKPPYDSVAVLRTALRNKCWQTAIKTYLRNYQRPLPAWVVYVDSLGGATQGVVSSGGPGFPSEDDTSSVLVGQRSVWALVFSDRPLWRTPESIRADVAARALALAGDASKQAGSNAGPVFEAFDSLASVRAGQTATSADQDLRIASTAATRARDALDMAVEALHRAPPSRRAQAARAVDSAQKRVTEANVARDAKQKAADDAHDAFLKAQLKKTSDSLMTIASRDAAEADLAAKRATAIATDTADLNFARRTVIFPQDPLITTIVKGLLAHFGAAPPDAAALPDSVRILRFQQVVSNSCAGNRSTVDGYRQGVAAGQAAADCVRDSMYVALGRFAVVDNSAVELSISPVAGKRFAPLTPDTALQRVYVNLANAKRHSFELGALAGVTHGRSIQTLGDDGSVKSTQASTAVNGYLTFHWNPRFLWLPVWYRENWKRAPLGLFWGTNVLSGTIGDQLITGVSLGRIFGDAGLSVGTALLPEQRFEDGHIVNGRTARLLVGTDLRF